MLNILTSLLVALPSLIAAILSIVNHFRVREVHLAINSRLDELIESVKKAAFAEGQASERENIK